MQLQGTLVARVQLEDLPHLAFGAVDVAAAQVTPGQLELFILAAQVVELAQSVLGPTVVGLDGQHPAVAHACRGEVAPRAVGVSLGQQFGDGPGPAAVEGQVQLGVTRMVTQALLDACQPGLVLALLDQVLALLLHDLGGAARDQGQAQAKMTQQQRWTFHWVLPTDKVWDKCSGR